MVEPSEDIVPVGMLRALAEEFSALYRDPSAIM